MTTSRYRSPAPLVRGSGPALLLAHGAGSDIQDSYGPVLDELARRHTVIGPDYPGSGDTPLPDAPLSLDALADHVVAAAVGAGAETFAVSGFSMGTTVAVRAATRHPDRVTALVLSSGFARPNPRLRLVLDVWRALGRTDDGRTLAAYLSLVVGGASWLDERTPEEVEEQLALFAAGLPAGTDEQLALFETIDVTGDLAAIRVPTLVVSPLEDVLTTPAHSRELAAGIPGAELATLDCGHAIALERPAEWASLITDFLARAAPDGARPVRDAAGA
ncbi:alpha/beta fold hydrolase [Streptomyces sudanensis]|uniref:alpha/beta fold hydrolase n=1 Tax=Streptomyces sudanensis TaxID=436397 RepID=UPI0020CBB928|nr:alpha/beta fold hydrolase [Streptomyces sudanensis]MCP9957577.1 alpha/beta hydrolase [Streptomyces sudanensis]MCQ0001881.1 alpha/beta hydrolase [Streptomyces sudanensis]